MRASANRIIRLATLAGCFTVAAGSVFAQQGGGVAPTVPSAAAAYNPIATEKMLQAVRGNLSPGEQAAKIRKQLALGADPNANNGEALTTLCQHDGELEAITALVESGANTMLDSAAALMNATLRGDLPVVRILVGKGKADPHTRDELALVLAAARGYPDLIDYYVGEQKLNPDGFDNSGKILGELAKAVDDNYLDADKARYGEAMRRLVQNLGAHVQINHNAAILKSVEYGVLYGTEKLLDLGADINTEGGMLLRMSLAAGRGKMTELLLSRGARPDMPDILYDLKQMDENPGKYSPAQKAAAALIRAAINDRNRSEKPAVAPVPHVS